MMRRSSAAGRPAAASAARRRPRPRCTARRRRGSAPCCPGRARAPLAARAAAAACSWALRAAVSASRFFCISTACFVLLSSSPRSCAASCANAAAICEASMATWRWWCWCVRGRERIVRVLRCGERVVVLCHRVCTLLRYGARATRASPRHQGCLIMLAQPRELQFLVTASAGCS